MAKDVAALKAVSQNLMHENLTVTDGEYGILSDAAVKRQIMGLGMQPKRSDDSRVDVLVDLTADRLRERGIRLDSTGRV